MPDAAYSQNSFLGGEWSKKAQGRFELPVYRTAMNVCLNTIPIESGAATRRSGTRFLAPTRNGVEGRLISFDFQQSSPYNMEFTTGYLRFFSGANLVTTNDDQAIASISTANPAKLATALAHGWSSGNQVMIEGVGVNNPLLHRRPFLITVTSATEFTLQDALTLTTIDGSTLGTFVSGTVKRILEIATPWGASAWPTIRSIQAQTTSILLQGQTIPQVLAVSSQPNASQYATLALTPSSLIDGPYLDPVAGGATVTPSALTGVITATIGFPTWSATTVYSKGDFVAYSSVNYKSLTDQNINLQPNTNPANWLPVNAGVAVGPTGFVGTDVGRAIRLFSEPALWVAGTTYAAKDVVSYNNVAWTALVGSNVGNQPGLDLTKWAINATGSIWSWGKITSIQSAISGTLAGSANIGDMTTAGGLSAAFDGVLPKTGSVSARLTSGARPSSFTSYVGKNYSGATDQKIAFAVINSASDIDFCQANFSSNIAVINFTFNLRAKQTLPASASDGTLLGTTGVLPTGRGTRTIVSTDATTAWKYVWIEMISTTVSGYLNAGDTLINTIAQVQLYAPASTGTSSATVSIQILGPALLYTTPVRTWRMGVYSDTTGWPTSGCYHEGRIWLAGSIGNRIDASASNGQSLINPEKINFAPTGSDGVVADSNAISYTFNSKDVNSIYWMEPDQQGIICGTQAGEWLVQASTLNSPLTPRSIQAHRVTKIGCANLEPRHAEHTLLFVQRHSRKVMEYFADVFSGKFSAPNLSERAKHLTIPGIAEIAYQQELAPILWARLSDGTLIGCTYKRDSLTSAQGPTFAGWHPHTLGSSREVESICVGPSEDGDLDSLALVTNDTTSNIRHVELMQDLFEEGGDIADGWFLDDAIVPAFSQNVTVAGVDCLQLGGLWHLNGKTVTAFIGGLDCGDRLVTNGIMNVPYNTANVLLTPAFVSGYVGTLPIVVGFPFTSDGQLVRPATPQESGARTGPALGKSRRTQTYVALLVDTQGVSFGTSFSKMLPAKLQTDGGTALTALQLKSGVHRDAPTDADSYDSMLCWRTSRPFPTTIAAMGGMLETKDQ